MAHIKCTSHSTGGGGAAVDYLLDEFDSKGIPRADVQVLRGNPQQVGQLIDSLKFIHRYTSMVLAFHKCDNPTNDEMETALDLFQSVAFAGLDPEQYDWTAVMHVAKDGSKHIHIIIPRVELTTGKSMNVAPPGWQKHYNPMRDALNFEHGWARPDDPRLARAVQPGAVASFEGWRKGTDPRQQITNWLKAQIDAGTVNNRQDILRELSTLGQINRAGRDYISIRAEEGEKPIRLKGPMYDENFNGAAFRSATTAKRPEGREEPDASAAAAARESLAAVIAQRAGYNRSRYKRKRDFAHEADEFADGPLLLPVGDRAASTTATTDRTKDKDKGVSDDGIRTTANEAIEQVVRSARAAIHAVERCAAAASESYRSVEQTCRYVDSVYRNFVAALTRAAAPVTALEWATQAAEPPQAPEGFRASRPQNALEMAISRPEPEPEDESNRHRPG